MKQIVKLSIMLAVILISLQACNLREKISEKMSSIVASMNIEGCQPIELTDGVITGYLDQSDSQENNKYYDCYTLSQTYAGGTIINLFSRYFDSYLYVNLPRGKSLENDDFESLFNSRVEITSEYNEPVTIKVSSSDTDETGYYTLRILPLSQADESISDIASSTKNSRAFNSEHGEQSGENYLSIGQTITGDLNDQDIVLDSGEYYDEYFIPMNAGDSITVDLSSQTMDAYLIIVPADGAQIDNDDIDPNSSTDAQISYTADKSGVVQVIATSNVIGESGEYTIYIKEGVPDIPGSGSKFFDTLTLPLSGEELTGSLETNDDTLESGEYTDNYVIVCAAGEILSVNMRSNDFDPYLILKYPDGYQEDFDDFMESTDAHIELNITNSGEYSLLATSYEPGATGSYTISANINTSNQLQTRSDSIYNIETITETLEASDDTLDTGEYYDYYTFNGTEGQQVNIYLESYEFDPYLMLVFPDESTEENDDASDFDTNARIEISLPETGEYEIVVTSYEPAESGEYELTYPASSTAGYEGDADTIDTVDTIDTGETIETVVDDNMQSDQQIASTDGYQKKTGSLDKDDETLESGEYTDTYEINIQEGDLIKIDLQSEEFDAYVIIIDDQDNQEENDDIEDGSGTSNSYLEFIARQTGTAEIIVTSYEPGEVGNYTISWSISPKESDIQDIAVDDDTTTTLNVSQSGRQYYGIFVGISDYPGLGSDLPLCDNDARKVAQAFENNRLMDKSNYVLLLNDQATRLGIREAFGRISPKVDSDDIFVFFYSGHGMQDDRENPQCQEADLRDEYLYVYDGELSDNEMAQFFDKINADVAILALDACFSGGFAKDVICKPNRMGIFSSEEDLTSSVADNFNAGGYLSYFFMKGITGDADNDPQDRTITAGEFSHYLILQFAKHVVNTVSAEDINGISRAGYQHLVIDRGGVRINDVLIKL